MSVMVSLQRECLQAVKRVESSNMTIQTQQRSILKELKELEELVREADKVLHIKRLWIWGKLY